MNCPLDAWRVFADDTVAYLSDNFRVNGPDVSLHESTITWYGAFFSTGMVNVIILAGLFVY